MHPGAQAPPDPAFEVASIKPNNSRSLGTQFGLPGGGRFTATNASARELVRMAYSVQDYELVGLPDWTTSAFYDINARADRDITLTGLGGPTPPVFLMLRSLLADRFKLKTHREKRAMPVYAMVMARADRKPGPRLKPSSTDCAAIFAAARAKQAAGAPPSPPVPPSDAVLCGSRGRPGYFAAGALSIESIAGRLSGLMGRLVIDRTGLTGPYDYVLEYMPDQVVPLPAGATPLPPINPNAPSLQPALEEQLGLKLESTKAPVEVIVVDSISQPTPD